MIPGAHPATDTWLSGPAPVTAGSTLLVAVIGAVALLAGAVVPELFKFWHRQQPVPPEVVTPLAMEVLGAALRAEIEARLSAMRSTVNSTRSEVRALRKALEARDEAMRDRVERVRDELLEHTLRAGLSGVVPEPREPT